MVEIQNGVKKYLDIGFINMTFNPGKNLRCEDNVMFASSKIET